MITPTLDKDVIKAILSTDSYIKGADFKPENILTTRASSDIVNVSNPVNQINISLDNPENTGSDMVKGIVYKITISAKRMLSPVVDSISEQVIALLHERSIGRGHILYLLDPFIELESDPSVYIVEATFLCQSTVFNVVQK